MNHIPNPDAAERAEAITKWRETLAALPDAPFDLPNDTEEAWAFLRNFDDAEIARALNAPRQAAAERAMTAWGELPVGINTRRRAARHGYLDQWEQIEAAIDQFNAIGLMYIGLIVHNLIDTSRSRWARGGTYRSALENMPPQAFLWSARHLSRSMCLGEVAGTIYGIQDGEPRLNSVAQADGLRDAYLQALDPQFAMDGATGMKYQHDAEYREFEWCLRNDVEPTLNGGRRR